MSKNLRASDDEPPIVGTAQLDRLGAFVQVNDGFCALSGYSREELLGGLAHIDLDHPVDREEDACKIEAWLQGTADYRVEKRCVRKDGGTIRVRASGVLIRDAVNLITGATVVVEEIASAIEGNQVSEKALKDQQALLETVTTDARVGLALVDREYRYVFVNPTYAMVLGLEADDLIGRTAPDVLGPLFEAQIKERADRALAGERIRYELQVPKRSGWTHDRYFEVAYEPPTGEGADACLVVVVMDITERRRAESEVRENRRRLEKAQEIGHIGSWDVGLAPGSPLNWSAETCRIFGVDPASFTGKGEDFVALLHEDDRDEVLRRAHVATREEQPYDVTYRICRPDGEVRWIHQHAYFEHDQTDQPARLVGVVQDFTERRTSHDRVLASEERYRLVANATRDPIWEIDVPSGVVSWNEAYDAMFGSRPDEAQGSWDWWTDRINENEREQVTRSLREVIANPAADRWAEDYHFRDASGAELLIQDRAFISRDENGTALRLVGTMRDQTPIVQEMKEREESERALQESQKLESLGVLAGGIAHDFNNLLTTMLGNVSLIREDLSDNSEHQEILEDVENSALRAADLCKQMLAYAGKGKYVVDPINLSSVVREIVQLLNLSISKHARLQLQLDADLPSTIADMTQINQVVMNLVINASEAIGKRDGTVSLSTGRLLVDAATLQSDRYEPPPEIGEYVYLEVSDNGDGMDEATRRRMFEPFYTTKFTGRGLGLAAVLGIIRGHHGSLCVESSPGAGTVFTILLPIHREPPGVLDGSASPSNELTTASSSNRNGGVILIVDDEEEVRTTAQRILERQGYEIVIAVDGLEAVQIFRKRHAELSLVLLDLNMPQMDGVAAFEEMQLLSSRVPVVLMSGYDEKSTIRQFPDNKIASFIQKPFLAETVVEHVRQATEQAKVEPISD
jgi:two-component system, cell cycle sensor histidine kinase and response regulator CckA